MRKTKSGFTIVELLIVIVVIGILAAITVVAYNGVQDRAKRTSQQAQVDAVGKAIKLYVAEKGKLAGDIAGSAGAWIGSFNSVYAGTSVSMKTVLENAGYLVGSSAGSDYLVALCTDANDNRRVVMTRFTDPAPTQTVVEQLTGSGCNTGAGSLVELYSNSSYTRNYARVY